MSNIYLEKIASTALVRNVAKGLVSSVTGLSRSGGKMGAAALNKAVTGASPTGMIRAEATRTRQMANGLKYNATAKTPARAVQSTDELARSNIKDRLVAHKAQQASLARTGSGAAATNTMAQMKMKTTQLVGRAKQMATDHPKAAIAGGAAGLAGAGYLAGKNNDDNNY